MMSKKRSRSTLRKIAAVTMVGSSSGRVMRRKVLNGEAPSICAASKTLGGNDCKPPEHDQRDIRRPLPGVDHRHRRNHPVSATPANPTAEPRCASGSNWRAERRIEDHEPHHAHHHRRHHEGRMNSERTIPRQPLGAKQQERQPDCREPAAATQRQDVKRAASPKGRARTRVSANQLA